MPTAVITGASQGLGRATARALAERGWSLVVDARHADELAAAVRGLTAVTAIPGDVTDPGHRARIAAAITPAGGSTCSSTTPAASAPARSRYCAATPWPNSARFTRPTCWHRWP